ncbi:MAG: PQQ-binding-like beta-propeller repeat protein [Caldilineaceae bacterium]
MSQAGSTAGFCLQRRLPAAAGARSRCHLRGRAHSRRRCFLAGAGQCRYPGTPNGFGLALPGGGPPGARSATTPTALQIDAAGPVTPTVLWSYQLPGGFTGRAAVGADGTVCAAGADGTVIALDGNGKEKQRWTIPAAPVSSPALRRRRHPVRSRCRPRALNAGARRQPHWRFTSEGRRPTSGPTVGLTEPSILRVDRIQAVSPEGLRDLGVVRRRRHDCRNPPRLSPDGTLIFLSNSIFFAATGEMRRWRCRSRTKCSS